mmetsp:Transcript_53142/g.106700  ORF Transcript_53142/g.106700 Transcript_53142/m.106700 type:complete len:249 (-) Transcript_53142:57-803(-)
MAGAVEARRRPRRSQSLPRGCWTPPGAGNRCRLGAGCQSPSAPSTYKGRHLLTDVSSLSSAVSGLDDSGVSTSSSSFGFFCQPLRPQNASLKDAAAPCAGNSHSRLLTRAHSLSDLSTRPPFSRRSGCEEQGEARPPSRGIPWGTGGRDLGTSSRDLGVGSRDLGEVPLRVRALPEWKEAGVPKVSQPGLPSPALCRRDGGGCPLSHASDSSGLLEAGLSPEEAVGVLTPLQGGVARPPSMRKLCSSW